jgi:large subunit ribosomal protein L23
MRNVLIKPLITEKITDLTEQSNKYGFVVALHANKVEIKHEIEKKFEVNVEKVNIIRHKGKAKTQFTRRGRFEGRTPRFKKAIVKLKEGQTIDLFEEV